MDNLGNNTFLCNEAKQPVYFAKSENKGKSLFSNFIDSIKNRFFPKPPPQNEERSKEIQKCTNLTLDKLLTVKNNLKSKVDEELFKQIEIAIDPIARDAKRIQKLISSKDDSNSIKTNKKFLQWAAKAERWTAKAEALDSKINLQISVIETIIDQAFMDANELIDQDLQVIEDYKVHLLSNLTATQEEKESVGKFINEHLASHIQELIRLKEKPEHFDISKVSTWKNDINQKRAGHFEDALHKIDAIIEQMSPVVDDEESNHELNHLEIEAKDIEKEAIALMFESLNDGALYDNKKTTLLSRMQWLQQKTHEQNLDLKLPKKQSEQLGKISSAIEKLNKNIGKIIPTPNTSP